MFHLQFRTTKARKLISVTLSLALYILMLPIVSSGPASPRVAAQSPSDGITPNAIPVIAPGSAYRQTNHVSDLPGVATIQDPLLVNPWGISLTGSSPFWVANAGTSTSTLYRETATTPFVKQPGMPNISIPGGLPTGTISNPVATEFVLPGACAAAPCGANFIFASITGNISGWDPNAPAAGSITAVIAASHPGRVYTGLAYGTNGGGNRLYAADFANGNIDVYDTTFALTTVTGNFTDPTIPTTAGNTYHPHNVQAVGTSLYVTYAKVGVDGRVENGAGKGYVRRFNTDGVKDLTFGIDQGLLDGPWGVALAPASFGIFGGALLVGNFAFDGAGTIHAYNPTTGAFLGTVQDESGQPVSNDGLWALQFGNGGNGGLPGTLYFTAGLAREEHGLLGSLKPTTASATSLIQFSTDGYIIGEGSGGIQITVTRDGDASNSASVNYATFDESQPGHGSQKSDYEIELGKVTFAPGETSKSFRVLIVDDVFVEGNEVVNLVLSNVTGSGVGLGTPNGATLTINDNDAAPATTNPIDAAQFFVRQHYLDFLNREPDPAGLAFWTAQITSCGSDAGCIATKRINVSAAFFLSIEFQNSGLAAYLTHRAAYGPTLGISPAPVFYGTFMRDLQAINRDVIVGAVGAEAQLEANKLAFYDDFVTRPEFVTKYPASLTNAQYVDNLLASANLSPSQVRLFAVNMTNGQEVPPAVPTLSTGGARPASFGTAKFQFNDAQTAMTFTATVNNIDITRSQTSDGNDNLAAAHIHAGAAVAPGVNGPVVWGFFGAPFNDNNPNDQVFAPLAVGVGGNFSGKWDAPEGNGTTLAAQLANLRAGRAYINFHTTQFPGGEIRGNFPAESAFRDSLVAGLNAATETRATVLRKVSEQEELKNLEFNKAFVLMEYFGYLRRDPDVAGFNFWLNKLNAFNGSFINAEMVKAFITSGEYRQRFGPN